MTADERNTLAKFRDAIMYVFEIHGLGYGEVIRRKLFQAELDFRRIEYQHRCPIEVQYDGEVVSTFKMKPLLIEDRLICDIKALNEKIDFYDIARIQSYLKALDKKIGVIVSFGKTRLEIRGIHV